MFLCIIKCVYLYVDKICIYSDAGTNKSVTGSIIGGGVFTIIAEADGTGESKWGKLKSGIGWIPLDIVTRL